MTGPYSSRPPWANYGREESHTPMIGDLRERLATLEASEKHALQVSSAHSLRMDRMAERTHATEEALRQQHHRLERLEPIPARLASLEQAHQQMLDRARYAIAVALLVLTAAGKIGWEEAIKIAKAMAGVG